MKTENIFLISILILVIAGFAYAILSSGIFASRNQATTPVPNSLGLNPILTGTTEQGDVSIELSPKAFVDGNLIVGLSANTHSIDLSKFDLKQITTLEYNGKAIKPTNAPAMSGHHVNGEIAFYVGEAISKFSITINSIPNVENRVFDWK
ncbi:hypothetical protein J4231_00015 [Candidatus Woesearchaeota archaeon]|nr:hypothetical protein [Candidatus Woesearchaeota archaeon]